MYFFWKSGSRFFYKRLTSFEWNHSADIVLRSQEDFVIYFDYCGKSHKVKITEANLYVRKLTLNDDVVSAIEKTLPSSPAPYLYSETITKTFFGLHWFA